MEDRRDQLARATFTLRPKRGFGICLAVSLAGCGGEGPSTPIPQPPPPSAPAMSLSFAYLTQAVQSTTSPVPLVAGDSALLRVFVVSQAGAAAGATLPPARVTFYHNDAPTYTADLRGTNVAIPSQRYEGDLSLSLNAIIPGSVVQPGVEMVVEIDPDRTLDPTLRVSERLPGAGRTRLRVLSVEPYRLVLVPFLWQDRPDSVFLAKVRSLTPDSPLLWATREFLPIHRLEITQHDPVIMSQEPSCDTISDILRRIRTLKLSAGSTDPWIALWQSGCGGAASFQGQYAGVGLGFDDFWQNNNVLAHEIGHLMTLKHAPCNVSRDDGAYDGDYPHSNGTIGAWGYDMRSNTLRPPDSPEVMSYCGEREKWISGYYLRQALRYRLGG